MLVMPWRRVKLRACPLPVRRDSIPAVADVKVSWQPDTLAHVRGLSFPRHGTDASGNPYDADMADGSVVGAAAKEAIRLMCSSSNRCCSCCICAMI